MEIELFFWNHRCQTDIIITHCHVWIAVIASAE